MMAAGSIASASAAADRPEDYTHFLEGLRKAGWREE
jgi:hypothetical protein